MVEERQTVRDHVDDGILSHVYIKANVWECLQNGQHGEVEMVRGKTHDVLEISLDSSNDGEVRDNMRKYVTDMIGDYSGALLQPKQVSETPAREMKISKRERSKAHLPIAFFKLVREPTKSNKTKHFFEAQGRDIDSVDSTVLYQGNKSCILLETNGRKSVRKRFRAINIRHFIIVDQVEKMNLVSEYCPTDEVTADFLSRSLQGQKLGGFCDVLLGIVKMKPPDDLISANNARPTT